MNNSDLSNSLAKMEPGKLPLEIFNQVARLTVVPVIEVVPFYTENGVTKVYLLQRPISDELWAGKYHVPGSIILPGNASGSFSDVVDRIKKTKFSEFDCGDEMFIGNFLCAVERGTEVAMVFSVDLKNKPQNNLFDYKDLPSSIINGQREFIEAAFEVKYI